MIKHEKLYMHITDIKGIPEDAVITNVTVDDSDMIFIDYVTLIGFQEEE